MHAIVNDLTLIESVDWPDLESKVEAFQAHVAAQRSDFRGVSLVRVSDTHGILLVLFDSLEALEDISKNIAGPWFAENLRHYLAGPVDRKTGEVVAGIMNQ